MAESIVQVVLDWCSGILSLPFGKEGVVFFISCLPILELRGGLIAAALLDMNPIISYIVCFIGNILPIPFILWLITPLFDRLKKTKRLSNVVKKLEAKAMNKKEQIEKYQFFGLLLFVGIPLPGTGAWTGSLIAAMLGMDKKKSLFAAILGVILAGIIMMILSFGVLKGIIG